MTRTWILVADASQARLFEIPAPGESFHLVQEVENVGPNTVADKEGKVASGGLPKQTDEQRFARQLAFLLDKSLTDGQYERLVIAAAPEFLTALREELSPQVEERLIDTVARDYMGADTDELEGRLTIAQLH